MESGPVSKVLLKDQIFERITKLIQNGELHPGQKLTVQKFCDMFGVSRTPVRDALTVLASEGTIDYIPRRGFFVKTFSDKARTDFYLVLCALEILAGNLYAERCTEDDLSKMQ